MGSAFKKIAIVCRPFTDHVAETLCALIRFLEDKKCYTIIVEADTAKIIKGKKTDLTVKPASTLGRHAEVIVVVGGDGSLLYGAHIAVLQKLPVIGINRGYLGFLSDIHPDNMDCLDRVLSGDYVMEDRSLLGVKVIENRKTLYQCISLNETVMLPTIQANMINYEIYVDDRFIARQRADGLLVATPTGSTAYALSAGGPIIHPQLQATLLIPMFPHTLSSRPLVLDDKSKIKVKVIDSPSSKITINCDGRRPFGFPYKATLHIQKYKDPLKLLHPTSYDYFKTLREKLAWHR
jgi:NAD+ kinase